MIVCGWCAHPTAGDPCTACGHADPGRPWVQRGQEPPKADRLDPTKVRRQLAEARRAIEAEGQRATVERLAERLEVSPRTVRRWREMSA